MRKRLLLIISLIMIMALLCACGSKEEAKSEDAASTEEGTESENSVSLNGSTAPVNMTIKIAGKNREGTYEGETENGIPQGTGLFTSHNDEGVKWTYRGNFSEGVPCGSGVISWEDKNAYRGEVSDGVPNGRGQWEYDGNILYTGDFENGKCIIMDRNKEDKFLREDSQIVNWGDFSFRIPSEWEYTVKDSGIKINAGDSQIAVSKFSKGKLSNQASRDKLKSLVEKTFSDIGSISILDEEYDAQDVTYYLEYGINGESLPYPYEGVMLSFQRGRDYYVITTVNTGIDDNSVTARCIKDTFTATALMY